MVLHQKTIDRKSSGKRASLRPARYGCVEKSVDFGSILEDQNRSMALLLWPLLASLLLLSLPGLQQVFGIELRMNLEPKVDERAESERTMGRWSFVDEKKRLEAEDESLMELFPEPDSHLRLFKTSNRNLSVDFSTCSTCTCCDSTRAHCRTGIPCCYVIKCDGLPFGVCKFVPIACNCSGCG